MKVTINLDVTPQEARTFFGLPDVEPLNQMIIEAMMKKAQEDLPKLADPERLMAQWVSMGGKGVEQVQGFMSAMMKGAMGGSGTGSGASGSSGGKADE